MDIHALLKLLQEDTSFDEVIGVVMEKISDENLNQFADDVRNLADELADLAGFLKEQV